MKRVFPGLALAAGWLILLLSGSFPFFWLVIYLLAIVGGYEYIKMALPSEAGQGDRYLLAAAIALPVLLTGLWHEGGLCGGLFLSFFLSICFVLIHYSQMQDSLSVLCRLVFGSVYIGFLMSHLLLIWLLPEGNQWLVILTAITAGSDSGAYYSGKTFGKHKLCPAVSPNKTIEGALGGLFFGLFAAAVFAAILLDNVNWGVLIVVAILLTGVGILGDLCESIIKRGTNTKDSGTILLGHGGILDRVDSLLLAAPVLYYLHIFTG